MGFSKEEKREKETIVHQVISVIKKEFGVVNSESESVGKALA